MKRVLLLAFTAIVALMAASCQKEKMGRVLTATIEQYEHNSKDGNGASKAYINDDHYACWEDGDLVNINGTQCTVSVSSESSTATIMGTEGLEGDLLAYYPASQVTSWSGNNVTVTLPQVQQYRESNGHQVIDNPMAAYCPDGGTELRFRNLCALLKVTIQAPSNEDLRITSIVVKGNDNQMLWGEARLRLDYQNKPILGEMSNGSNFVDLYFESPKTVTAGNSKNFYIVVPAGSDFLNFTITVATDQKVYRKETPLGHTLLRNHIGALSYTPAAADKVYAILYTGSIEGFRSNAFGEANVVSSTDGVICFNQPVTTIGASAFWGCNSLTTISLPAGVTSIGNSAFSGCSSLTLIYLPAEVTSIGNSAFSGCSSLTLIYLPAEVTSIGGDAFLGCSSLTRISLPAGVTSIGNDAFRECSNLTSITLPPNLTEIKNRTFENCSSLTSMSLPASVTSIGNNAFAGCSNLSDITLPTNLTSIKMDAFWGCSSLTSISLPEGVTSIGYWTFLGCSSLTTVYVNRWVEGDNPKITPFGEEMFLECTSLNKIYVPAAAVEAYKNASGWNQYSDIISAMPTE